MKNFFLARYWAVVGTAAFCSILSFNLLGRPRNAVAVNGEAGDVRSPRVVLRPSSFMKFPGRTDSNSPAHWDGNILYLFNSAPPPFRSSAADLFHLSAPIEAVYDKKANGGRWIESTWRAADGTLYGWYHNEPHPVCPSKPELTAPRIGAARSKDNGGHWEDLGFVLEAPPSPPRCDTEDKYFAGGNGDFSVIPDRSMRFVYFLISTYYPDAKEEGIAVARMKYSDRDDPVGKVWKWYRGRWSERGIGGSLTPVFPVKTPWHRKDVDAFWGPSIHWNTHLETFVILMNRAMDRNWSQEGIYVSFNPRLDDPYRWTKPRRILDANHIHEGSPKTPGWYPQVIGLEKGETDKLAGREARLFIHGQSSWEITFLRPGEAAK